MEGRATRPVKARFIPATACSLARLSRCGFTLFGARAHHEHATGVVRSPHSRATLSRLAALQLAATPCRANRNAQDVARHDSRSAGGRRTPAPRARGPFSALPSSFMKIMHLTDSPFYGGPERQILGLSVSLPSGIDTTVVCFRDHLSCQPFIARLEAAKVRTDMLDHATPRYHRMVTDVRQRLRRLGADLLVCHGYKADILGLVAARREGIP